MDIVEIRHLKKYFKDGSQVVKALDGIDLAIEKGRFTVIAGASGSGKTTLLNTIAGLYEPTEGTVIVDGLDLSKMGEEQLTVFRRRKIGFVFQGYNLIPELTVKENIMFPLALDDTR
ncbi:MAG: ATP-binding cassette domain-containing protein, partial [Lachnospiraceae bacterium]|nr:ATP-binding cassette domain-containing protein [Lachnospiraceae bacterium]